MAGRIEKGDHVERKFSHSSDCDYDTGTIVGNHYDDDGDRMVVVRWLIAGGPRIEDPEDLTKLEN